MSVSIVPHSGVEGSCGPSPRKPSAATSMIAVASASVPCTITGEIAFGRMWEARIERFGTPIDARREHEVVVPLGEDRAAHQPREDRHLRHADRDHDLEDAGTEHRDDPDREQQAGDREHDVRQAHDHAVDDPADVARDRAEHHADREADRDRDDADQERVARAVEDPRELVAPLLVDSEPVLGRRAGAAASAESREIADARILGREERREEGADDEDPDDREADQRSRVPAQARPGVAPETSASRARAGSLWLRSRRRS